MLGMQCPSESCYLSIEEILTQSCSADLKIKVNTQKKGSGFDAALYWASVGTGNPKGDASTFQVVGWEE